jgi:hypothetical protein
VRRVNIALQAGLGENEDISSAIAGFFNKTDDPLEIRSFVVSHRHIDGSECDLHPALTLRLALPLNMPDGRQSLIPASGLARQMSCSRVQEAF